MYLFVLYFSWSLARSRVALRRLRAHWRSAHYARGGDALPASCSDALLTTDFHNKKPVFTHIFTVFAANS